LTSCHGQPVSAEWLDEYSGAFVLDIAVGRVGVIAGYVWLRLYSQLAVQAGEKPFHLQHIRNRPRWCNWLAT